MVIFLKFSFKLNYYFREEMALEVTILAEKYTTDYMCVDVILNLAILTGDYVSEMDCHRVIQIVELNSKEMIFRYFLEQLRGTFFCF